MTDAGPLDLIDDENSDVDVGIDQQRRGNLGQGLPGSITNLGRAIVRTKCLKTAATTEGVLIYSIDESFIFDPTDLDIDVTPEELFKIHGNFIQQNSRSLLPALRSLQKSITKCHQDLMDVSSSNEYMLQYLCSTAAR